MPLIDLTRTISDDMPVFPGDAPVRLKTVATIEDDGFTNSRLSCGMHIGTHIDGPLHMIAGGKRLIDMSPDYFIGRGVLLDARGYNLLEPGLLASVTIHPGDILLIRTGWSAHFGTPRYYDDYPVLTPETARAIVDSGVKMVGLDSPSPDRAPYPIHPILLGNEVLILENLEGLEKLAGFSSFELFALPLKMESDSAPARVFARV